jgi:predicted ATPase
MPFLKNIRIDKEKVEPGQFPFTIPILSKGLDLDITSNVTFLVGENGTGKSTLLEAIADGCGFNLAGGNRNHNYSRYPTESNLSSAMRLSWYPKVTNGFFMRAESFFNFATYIDELEDPGILGAYGGKSLHQQSHGEAFFSLFLNRFHQGIYILDEPEAALSPNRQLAFLAIIHELEKSDKAQFIIATHSPILLCYPGAVVLSLDGDEIKQIDYRDSEHYRLTKEFLDDPDRYFHHLFSDQG